MNIAREYSLNRTYFREDSIFSKSTVNDDFLLVTYIHFFTFFFIFRFFIKHSLWWSSFLFTIWMYLFEAILLIFINSDEYLLFINYMIFFYFFICIFICFYAYSFYFRFNIMAFFTISKYTQYWFKTVIDELNYTFIGHFFTKNSQDYINKDILNYLKKKNFTNYFIAQRNINKNFLKFSLNIWINIYIYIIGLFYLIFIIYFTYLHFINFFYWFDRASYDLFVLWGRRKFKILIWIYCLFFFKIFLNSVCFNQFLSINFLRFFNFSKQLEVTDDMMDWESSTFETIVINEEFSPEDTSIYLMDDDLGDYDHIMSYSDEFIDLETTEVNYRFHMPIEWLNYKTYVIDSYDYNIFQYINMSKDNLFDYYWGGFRSSEALKNSFIENNLKLNI